MRSLYSITSTTTPIARPSITSLALTIVFCISSCLYSCVTADVRISEPAPQGGYQRAAHRLAAFGPPIHHNEVISADIIPFQVFKKSAKHGCEPFELNTLQPKHGVAPSRKRPWIAVISRGQCTFEQKIRTAMQMGSFFFLDALAFFPSLARFLPLWTGTYARRHCRHTDRRHRSYCGQS